MEMIIIIENINGGFTGGGLGCPVAVPVDQSPLILAYTYQQKRAIWSITRKD